MKRALLAGVLALAGIGGCYVPSAMAVPEPSLVPPKDTYELTFKQQSPERLEVNDNGVKKTYWFIRYTVTNNSGQDVVFTPEFELITDTGQSVKAYKDVPRSVYEKIKKDYNSEFMMSPFEVLGKLLQGAENARDGVAIFTGIETESRAFSIYVTGLANEVAKVKNPATGAEVSLVKTLQIDYKMPGEQIDIDPKPQFKGKKWIMKEGGEAHKAEAAK